jgi:hypothetical protein
LAAAAETAAALVLAAVMAAAFDFSNRGSLELSNKYAAAVALVSISRAAFANLADMALCANYDFTRDLQCLSACMHNLWHFRRIGRVLGFEILFAAVR